MSLSQLVQSLPQELYDQILELTLTLDSSAAHPDEVNIDKDYKSPPQLQINRACRRKFASKYFSTAIFYVKEPDDWITNKYLLLAKWLNSLPKEHRNLLPDSVVRIDSCPRRNLRFEEELHDAALSVFVFRNWLARELEDDCHRRLCDVAAWKRVGNGKDDYDKIWFNTGSTKAKLAAALQEGNALWL